MNKLKAPQREDSINIFALDRQNDFLFLSPDQRNLLVVLGKHLKKNSSIEDNFHKLATSPSITFNINKLVFSSTCKNLCIVGDNSCVILEITPRCRSDILREQDTVCRAYYLGEFLFTMYPSTHILQVKWHSYSENHIAVLTSDNILRLFNIAVSTDEPEQTFRLNELPRNTDNALPQVISFSFGSNLRMWDRFTVYFTTTTGSIFALCPVVPYNCLIQASFINSPLDEINQILSQTNPNPVDFETMFYYNELLNWLGDIQGETIATPKETESSFDKKKSSGWIKTKTPPYQRRDDFNLSDIYLQGPIDVHLNEQAYGDEICGIWTLNSYPTTLIRVFRSGLVQSLINFDEIVPQWEGLQKKVTSPEFLLFERLSLSLDYGDYLPDLTIDPIHRDRIYIHHNDGVHRVNVSWISKLESFVESSEDLSRLPDLPKSKITRLLSTAPLPESTPSPIIGMCIVTNPTIGYFMMTLNSDSKYAIVNLDSGLESIKKLPPVNSSTNVELSKKIPLFEEFITSQQNRKSIPNISSGKDSQLTGTAGLGFLLKTVNTMNKIDVKYIYQLQAEIVSRITLLEKMKKAQEAELSEIKKEIAVAQSNEKMISMKVQQAVSEQQKIIATIHRIVIKISARQHFELSHAERDYFKELTDKSRIIGGLNETIKQFQLETQKLFADDKRKTSTTTPITLSLRRQMDKMEPVLEEEGKLIEDTILSLKKLKIDIDQELQSFSLK